MYDPEVDNLTYPPDEFMLNMFEPEIVQVPIYPAEAFIEPDNDTS